VGFDHVSSLADFLASLERAAAILADCQIAQRERKGRSLKTLQRLDQSLALRSASVDEPRHG
jgi:hypothetical protein